MIRKGVVSQMPMTSKEMIKYLQKNGFEIVSQNRSEERRVGKECRL